MSGHGRASTAALLGASGVTIEVEATLSAGPARFQLIGLPEAARIPTQNRVREAVRSQSTWPSGSLSAVIAPVSIRKVGSGFDLAIAVAALRARTSACRVDGDRTVFIAELAPDGSLLPVRGVLPMVLAARHAGFSAVCVAEPDAAEAGQVPGIDVVGLRTLRQAIAYADGAAVPDEPAPLPREAAATPVPRLRDRGAPDLADLPEGYPARLALEVSAAGGHHILLLGDPDTPKAQIAANLAHLLPPLDEHAALEVAALRSLAGTLDSSRPLDTAAPLCTVRPPATVTAMVGGGSNVIRPGAVSLAHRGVLLLDDAPRLAPAVLAGLAESVESGEAQIRRAGATSSFPAHFLLAMTSSRCPCRGSTPPSSNCVCSARRRAEYLRRIPGPLLDRIDLRVAVHPNNPERRDDTASTGGTRAQSAERVQQARQRAARRLKDTPWRVNSEVPARFLRVNHPPAPGSLDAAEQALRVGLLTVRGLDRVVRVAWSLADLAGSDRPGQAEMDTALDFRIAFGR